MKVLWITIRKGKAMRRGRDFWIVEVEKPMGTEIHSKLFHGEQDAREWAEIEYAAFPFIVFQVKVTGKKTVVGAGK